MTFNCFCSNGLQKLIEAITTLQLGLFSVDDLALTLEEKLSESEYQLLLEELNYEHLFIIA